MRYLLYHFIGGQDRTLSLDYQALRNVGLRFGPNARLKVFNAFMETPLREMHWLTIRIVPDASIVPDARMDNHEPA